MSEKIENGKKLVRGWQFLVAAAWVVAGASCGREGGATGPGAPVPGGILYLAIPTVDTLDPLFLDDVFESEVAANLFNGLVKYDENLAVVPDLADEWRVLDGGRTYLFQLHKGVKFHDGSDLTAQDVLFTFRRALTLKNQPNAASEVLFRLLEPVAPNAPPSTAITAPGPYSVRICIRRPYPEFLKILAIDTYRVVSERHFPLDSPLRRPPYVGTGPFALDKWDEKEIVLRRNPKYFKHTVYLDGARYTILPDLTKKAMGDLFAQGKLDVLSASVFKRPEDLFPHTHIFKKAQMSTSFLLFNCQRAPTDSQPFRKAFVRAFDWEGYGGRKNPQIVRTEAILPPGMSLGSPISGRYVQDKAEAGRLLAAAAVRPKPGQPLIFLDQGGDDYLFKFVREAAQALGFEVKREVVEWDKFNRRLEGGDFHLTMTAWNADAPIPELFYHSLLASSSTQNFSRLKDQALDEMILRLYEIQNMQEKEAAIRKIEDRAWETLPLVPMDNYILIFLARPKVQNFRISPFGEMGFYLEDVWLDPAPARYTNGPEGS